MADEISRADPRGANAPKQNVETVEQTTARVDDDNDNKKIIASESGVGARAGAGMDPAHRARVERSLLRKLDTRCSLFVLIYIVSTQRITQLCSLAGSPQRAPAHASAAGC